MISLLLAAIVAVPCEIATSPTAAAPRDGRWLAVVRARGKRMMTNRGGLIVIGDSIAARWPLDLQKRRFGKPFINLGVGGDTSSNVMWRMGSYDLSQADSPAVLIIIGANDIKAKVKPGIIAANIYKIADWARITLPRRPVLVAEILPRGEDMMQADDAIRCVNGLLAAGAERHGYDVVKLHDPVKAAAAPRLPGKLFADMVHPNRAGYQLIGGKVAMILRSQGTQGRPTLR